MPSRKGACVFGLWSGEPRNSRRGVKLRKRDKKGSIALNVDWCIGDTRDSELGFYDPVQSLPYSSRSFQIPLDSSPKASTIHPSRRPSPRFDGLKTCRPLLGNIAPTMALELLLHIFLLNIPSNVQRPNFDSSITDLVHKLVRLSYTPGRGPLDMTH